MKVPASRIAIFQVGNSQVGTLREGLYRPHIALLSLCEPYMAW